jgi:hypothetical protein
MAFFLQTSKVFALLFDLPSSLCIQHEFKKMQQGLVELFELNRMHAFSTATGGAKFRARGPRSWLKSEFY